MSPAGGLALSAPFIAIAALFIIYPFIRLVLTALGDPVTLDHVAAYLDNRANLNVLRTTFLASAVVAAIAIVLGSLIAWALRTTNSAAMRLLLYAAVFVPFWMGSVTKIYAFTVLLERLGAVNRLLLSLGLIDTPLPLLYNHFAVILGMVYQMLPFAVLPCYIAFLTIDINLVLAAESLGASRLRALVGIVIPLSLPGLLATATIVYVICLGFFLTPVLLGGDSAQFAASLISRNIFTYYDLPGAAVSSLVLLTGAFVVIVGGTAAVGRDRLRRALG